MSSVKVAVRVRPFNNREIVRDCKCIIEMADNTTSKLGIRTDLLTTTIFGSREMWAYPFHSIGSAKPIIFHFYNSGSYFVQVVLRSTSLHADALWRPMSRVWPTDSFFNWIFKDIIRLCFVSIFSLRPVPRLPLMSAIFSIPPTSQRLTPSISINYSCFIYFVEPCFIKISSFIF